MRPAISWAVAISLAASTACAFQQPTETAHADKTQRSANQQGSPDATPSRRSKIQTSQNVRRRDQKWGWVWREDLRNDDHPNKALSHHRAFGLSRRRKEGIRRVVQDGNKNNQSGEVQDKPATKPASTEDRAVVILPATKECREVTSILRSAGASLRIIESCSAEADDQGERLCFWRNDILAWDTAECRIRSVFR